VVAVRPFGARECSVVRRFSRAAVGFGGSVVRSRGRRGRGRGFGRSAVRGSVARGFGCAAVRPFGQTVAQVNVRGCAGRCRRLRLLKTVQNEQSWNIYF